MNKVAWGVREVAGPGLFLTAAAVIAFLWITLDTSYLYLPLASVTKMDELSFDWGVLWRAFLSVIGLWLAGRNWAKWHKLNHPE